MVDVVDPVNTRTAGEPSEAVARPWGPVPSWVITIGSLVLLLGTWEIFGRDTAGTQFKDIVGLFRAENAEAVRERLAKMAGRLGIPVDSIPKFLEDYGDIFMSLSYYRQCLDHLLPQVQNFMEGIAMVRSSHQLAQDRSLMEVVALTEATINGMMSSVTGKIESFERSGADEKHNRHDVFDRVSGREAQQQLAIDRAQFDAGVIGSRHEPAPQNGRAKDASKSRGELVHDRSSSQKTRIYSLPNRPDPQG